MANVKTKKGVIGILTGGGDVPGLNPAIRAVTLRALREGYQVVAPAAPEAPFSILRGRIPPASASLTFPRTSKTNTPRKRTT